jgi:mRNA interferase MazF
MEIRRGDIVLVNFNPIVGNEMGKQRPALVIQNDIGNKYSNTTIVIPISSSNIKKEIPTLVFLPKTKSGLSDDSIINCSQIRTIDKKRIINKLKKVDLVIFKEIDKAIMISLGINF